MANILDLIEDSEQTAIIFEGHRVSYARLRQAGRSLAGQLAARGVRAGDVVSMLLPNSPAFVAGYLACWQLGATANPLNSRLTTDALARQVRHAGSRLLITSSALSDNARALVDHAIAAADTDLDLSLLGLDDEAELSLYPPPPDESRQHELHAGGRQPAVLIYTSGTTGSPKGVLLAHENIMVNARGLAERRGVGRGHRTVCFMPLFHCNALVFSHLSTFVNSGTVVLLRRFSASTLWDVVEDTDANSFSCPPSVLSILLDRTPPERSTPASLEYVKVGAAPLSHSLATEFVQRFAVPLIEGYGLTESTATSTMHDPRTPLAPATVGWPLSGQEIRIVDDQRRPRPAGVVGEIEIGGGAVMLGYHRDPVSTSETVIDGWLRTGDLGYLDEAQLLHLVGRTKELIIRGGENIFPSAIDEVLRTHPQLRDGAAYAVPDRIWGESPAVAVVPDGPLDVAGFWEFLRERLPDFSMPVDVRIVESIPRNAVGKVQRHELSKLGPTGDGGNAPTAPDQGVHP